MAHFWFWRKSAHFGTHFIWYPDKKYFLEPWVGGWKKMPKSPLAPAAGRVGGSGGPVKKKKITWSLQICIGPTIRIGRESWCLPYAGFFLLPTKFKFFHTSLPTIGHFNHHHHYTYKKNNHNTHHRRQKKHCCYFGLLYIMGKVSLLLVGLESSCWGQIGVEFNFPIHCIIK